MSTPASEPARYKGPAEDEMTEGQRQVYDEICRNRTTGIKGPFGPWLANPVLADAAQTLGRVCRYETSFTLRESELAILMTAVHHKAPTEWAIHVGEARKAGMPEEVIAALEQGATPPGMSEREAAIHTMAKELLANSTVSAGAYGQAVRVLGDTATVELVSIVGYYTYVAYTLNAFQIQA
eukprot:TRINITY_DN32367_c0_g1_i2.p2 TRINITY_DN32367_c0_g1~~TRINITY_DN32367_c0_g1_i2.p2  ORF type:complete len:181 (+),score=53.71 TRINITY_DN32367_c0_g1_i2:64-606(+)